MLVLKIQKNVIICRELFVDNYKNDSLLIIGIIINLKYNNKKKILT